MWIAKTRDEGDWFEDPWGACLEAYRVLTDAKPKLANKYRNGMMSTYSRIFTIDATKVDVVALTLEGGWRSTSTGRRVRYW